MPQLSRRHFMSLFKRSKVRVPLKLNLLEKEGDSSIIMSEICNASFEDEGVGNSSTTTHESLVRH
jgi:hypothetical protein